MRETKQHTIGDCTYDIQQLGGKQGRQVLTRIAKLVGPAAASENPIAAITAGMNDTDLDFVCDIFSKNTRVLGANSSSRVLADSFDDHFAGKYSQMMKWLWACVETNYADFLAELGLNPEALKAATDKAKTAMVAAGPTGESGASSPKAGGA